MTQDTIARATQKALGRMAELWEQHKTVVREEARTLAGALALMRKHGCKHPYEAIEQEAKCRAIRQFKEEMALAESAL